MPEGPRIRGALRQEITLRIAWRMRQVLLVRLSSAQPYRLDGALGRLLPDRWSIGPAAVRAALLRGRGAAGPGRAACGTIGAWKHRCPRWSSPAVPAGCTLTPRRSWTAASG